MLQVLGCALYPKIENFVEQQPIQMRLERKVLSIPNGQISYWEGGNSNGEPLVWLHGFGGDAMWAWVRNIPKFTDRYHIIAPDLLAFGDSFGGTNLDSQANAILKVLIAEDIERAHFVALSYGGFVALKMLGTHRVHSLTLVGVGGLGWTDAEFDALALEFDVEDVSSIFVPETPEDIRTLLDVCFHLPTVFVPRSFDKELYGNVFGKNPEEQRELLANLQLEASMVSSWTTKMAEPTPSLLIVGRQDPIFSVNDVRQLSNRLSGEVNVYGLADHVPQVGYSKKFNRDLKEFLSQHAMMPSIETEVIE